MRNDDSRHLADRKDDAARDAGGFPEVSGTRHVPPDIPSWSVRAFRDLGIMDDEQITRYFRIWA